VVFFSNCSYIFRKQKRERASVTMRKQKKERERERGESERKDDREILEVEEKIKIRKSA
jgi:hypothetical protein